VQPLEDGPGPGAAWVVQAAVAAGLAAQEQTANGLLLPTHKYLRSR
jgi:hypothetical protein